MNAQEVSPPTPDLDQERWFVCQANPQRMTRSLREMLDHHGVPYFMALHKVLRKQGQTLIEQEESWLGSFFFVRSTLRMALKLKFDNGLDYQYVRDGRKQLLWVPDKQMRDFRLVVESIPDKVDFHADVYAVGDHVIVTRGPLCGVEGILVEADEKKMNLLLKIHGVLAISVKIAKSNVRKVVSVSN